jgi:N-acetylneuraminic acid mutarotase
MKALFKYCTFILIFSITTAFAQPNANYFTWLKGMRSPQNRVGVEDNPSLRNYSMSWTLNGKLYLFGGSFQTNAGNNLFYNDLWEYNPTNNIWTLIKGTIEGNSMGSYGTQGISVTSNLPMPRSKGSTWVLNNKLYLFGGYATDDIADPLNYNDLWEFDLNTNNWTWVKGANIPYDAGNFGVKGVENFMNNPSSRYGSYSWVYNGNLYLFGGTLDNDLLNSFWLYKPATNNWTWIGGSNFVNQIGQYGTQGLGSTQNIPGARKGGSYAIINNKFYLFGGYGYGQNSLGSLNDLWEFNVLNSEWRYISGSTDANAQGYFNSFFFNTRPGARSNSNLIAFNNSLYLFGGYGKNTQNLTGFLNELFEYNTNFENWTFKAGSLDINDLGIYTVFGTPNAIVRPSSRVGASSWFLNGKMYIFGGNDEFGYSNDLWSYTIPCDGSTRFFSLKNGVWNDPTTWSCGRVPENTSSIRIKGHTVTINGNFGIKTIDFEGGSLVLPGTNTLTYYSLPQ